MLTLKNLQMLAIAAGIVLLATMLSGALLLGGTGALFDASNVFFALSFWLASGTVGGLVLGKMNAAAVRVNSGRKPTAIEDLIVLVSCHPLPDGRVVQANIANLWSAIIGAAVVYASCQVLSLLTGIAALGTFPQGVVYVIPFVIAWKVVENWTTRALLRRSGLA